MSSSFTSEIMDDELNIILLELAPDEEHARYASIEGWLNLTPEAKNAVQLRSAHPANWNEPRQYTYESEHYATYVCNFCYNFVASVDKSIVIKKETPSIECTRELVLNRIATN